MVPVFFVNVPNFFRLCRGATGLAIVAADVPPSTAPGAAGRARVGGGRSLREGRRALRPGTPGCVSDTYRRGRFQ